MTDYADILAKSTSLLKHDPGVAKAMTNRAPRGSVGAHKVKALTSLISRQTPSVKDPPLDPLGFLQRAIAIVLEGEANRGVSLSRVVERTNLHDPLTQTCLALRAIRHSIRDIAEMQDDTDAYADWSPIQRAAIRHTSSGKTRGLVFLGFRVEVPALQDALGNLRALEQSLSSANSCRPVVMGCLVLVTRSLHQLQPHLAKAGSDWLDMRLLPGKPGQYLFVIVPPEQVIVDEPAPVAGSNSRPALTSIDILLWWVEAMIERCLQDGKWTEVSQAAAVAMVRERASGLYDRAIKTMPVGDVHLAVRRLIDRKQAALDAQTAAPQIAGEDMPALLLLTDQAASTRVGEAMYA